MIDTTPLFDRLAMIDPVGGLPLEPIVRARTPAGVPICGALRIQGTERAYPIVDCVARLTPELAKRHARWLEPLGLRPPDVDGDSFQLEDTVDSFGFQWSWNAHMRSEADLRWRVASRFGVDETLFNDKLVLDAGSGAGDQTAWMQRHGASVVSIDLSSAIGVVAAKMRLHSNWVGVQGDITRLPFGGETFDLIYCEGVIQHTRDSAGTVRELLRMLRAGGTILASHYAASPRLRGRLREAYTDVVRQRTSRMNRYRLLLFTGLMATAAYVPGLRWLVRHSGTAQHSDLMPDFKTTWTNTFDWYGTHSFQRVIPTETFQRYFEEAATIEMQHHAPGVIRARKIA
jgi:2-polyprenyl-3-methyl-5-hydroxy-6-metoxy-1,4-benzoquinol methylase